MAQRKKELKEIKRLRRVLANRLRGGNIAESTYARGCEILDARELPLSRASEPITLQMPEPLDPYGSAMMVARKPTAAQLRSKGRWPKPTPRQEARAKGETYYVGKVCKRGHEPAFRSVVNGSCMACTELWESENRDRVRAIWRESKQRARDRLAIAKVERAKTYSRSRS